MRLSPLPACVVSAGLRSFYDYGRRHLYSLKMADKMHPPRTVSPPTHTSLWPIFSISSIGIDGRNTSYRAECPKVESVRRRYGRRTPSALGRLQPLTQSKIHLDLGWTQTDCIFLCPVVRGVQQYKIYRPHTVISHKEVRKTHFLD